MPSCPCCCSSPPPGHPYGAANPRRGLVISPPAKCPSTAAQLKQPPPYGPLNDGHQPPQLPCPARSLARGARAKQRVGLPRPSWRHPDPGAGSRPAPADPAARSTVSAYPLRAAPALPITPPCATHAASRARALSHASRHHCRLTTTFPSTPSHPSARLASAPPLNRDLQLYILR